MVPVSRPGIGLISCAVFSALMLSPSSSRAASNGDLMSVIRQQQQQIQQLQDRLGKLENQSQQTAQQAQQADTAAQAATEEATKASQSVETQAASAPKVEWGKGALPTISSPDGDYSFHVNGRIYGDYNFVRANNNPSGNRFNTSAAYLRSARIGVDGKLASVFQYRFNVDFANGTDVKDAYLDYNPKFTLPFFFRAGQFKTPNGLEQVANDYDNTFTEQAGFIGGSTGNGFGLGRAIGAGAAAERPDDDYTVAFGAFSQNAAESTTAKSGGYQLAARATKSFNYDDVKTDIIHVGGSVRWRDLNNQTNNETVIYRARPYFYDTNRSINTGNLNNVAGDLFLGPEFALVRGPFTFQTEGGWLWVDGTHGRDNASGLWGGYADVSYYLTGETRRYQRGAFRTTKVLNPVNQGGWGAWQLAARVDYLDLNDFDSDIRGGQQWIAALGVNWLPLDYIKMSLVYAHTEVFKGNGITTSGEDNSIDGLGARVAINF